MSEAQETGKQSKVRFTYIISAIAISCLMIGASLGIMISATTPSIPTVIEPGSNVIGADFVVFTSVGTYYAKNGTTGEIEAFNSNITNLIEGLVTLLPQNGGKIVMAHGDYTLNHLIIITKSNVTLWGQGLSTRLIAGPGLLSQSNPEMIISQELTSGGDIAFLNFQMGGTVWGWHGAPGSHSNFVHDCYFENSGSTYAGAIDASNSYNNIISNNILQSCNVGIGLSGTITQFGNIIANNQIQNSVLGIYCEYPYNTTIIGNNIQASNAGILILGSYLQRGGILISSNSIAAGNAGIGFPGPGTYGEYENITISANSIRVMTAYKFGMDLGQTRNVQVIGNLVTSTSNNVEGILITGGSEGLITGNLIYLGVSGEDYGIHLRSGASRFFISGNQIDAYYGIYLGSDTECSNNSLMGNFISNSNTGVLLSSGSNVAVDTLIDGNCFYSITTCITDNGIRTVHQNNMKSSAAGWVTAD